MYHGCPKPSGRSGSALRSRGAAARPTDRDRAHYERECAALKELAVQFHHCDTKAVDGRSLGRSGCGLWDGRYRTSLARSEQWEEEEAG